MVSLGSLQSGVAPFNPATPLDSLMKSLDVPSKVRSGFEFLVFFERQIVRSNVGNVTIIGNNLVDLNEAVDFQSNLADLFGNPVQVFDTDIGSLFFGDQAIALQTIDPFSSVALDQFEIFNGSEP